MTPEPESVYPPCPRCGASEDLHVCPPPANLVSAVGQHAESGSGLHEGLNPSEPRPRLLDLFCGAGGAAMGYHRAGFDVSGMDIKAQPNYPFRYARMDAVGYLEWLVEGRDLGRCSVYDAIHASPPCQHYSDLAHRNGNAHEHPDLIGPVRALLALTGLPYVIENVEGSPLLSPVTLCGASFPSLRVIRHRLFETNFPVPAMPHHKHPLCYTRDKRKAHYGKLDEMVDYVSVHGGGNCSVAAAQDAMGIDWMTKAELNEAIPPAYTTWIGFHLMRHLRSQCMKRRGTVAGGIPAEDVIDYEEWVA